MYKTNFNGTLTVPVCYGRFRNLLRKQSYDVNRFMDVKAVAYTLLLLLLLLLILLLLLLLLSLLLFVYLFIYLLVQFKFRTRETITI